MIKKRINTDLFLHLIFKNKMMDTAIDLTGAENLLLKIKKENDRSAKWIEQKFTIDENGVLSFQWNATENNQLGIFDALLSFTKQSTLSETGILKYYYDKIGLFEIVATSDDENISDDDVIEVITEGVLQYGGADGLNAYEVWKNIEGNEGKTMDDYLTFLLQPGIDRLENLTSKYENGKLTINI